MTTTVKTLAQTMTRPGFQAWLEARHPRTYVGTVGNRDACPLAHFLKSSLGTRDVEVDDGYIGVNQNADYDDDADVGVSLDTPGWAINFIDRVDSIGGYRVTAQRALKILKASRAGGSVPAR